MAVREDLVASAVQFLRDPSVASSPVESRVAFLRSKNLTPEEIDVAIARTSTPTAEPPAHATPATPASSMPYYQPYPSQYQWQQPPPSVLRRDWRDWFIMATVMSGVGYGVYTLAKRYVYPMIAPPTPERLEQDKKSIEEQFDKAFALVEQLARDTEALKAAEKDRTERLDAALEEVESVLKELNMSNRRLDDDTQRIRQDIQNLQDSIPKAVEAQKEATDQRLKELNKELLGLKTLLSSVSHPATTGVGSTVYTNGTSTSMSTSQEKTAASETESMPLVSSGQGSDAGGRPATPTYQLGSSSTTRSIPSWQRSIAMKNSSEIAGGSSSS